MDNGDKKPAIWVDADGCPKGVLQAADRLANEFGCQCIVVATYDHQLDHQNRVTVEKGDQSTDLYIVNRIGKGDLVVTQDIGLAAICMAKGANGIHVSGHVYSDEEMLQVLELRAYSAKARRAGFHTKGPKKRTKFDDASFFRSLYKLLSGTND
jgi:uncharacterized protein